MKPNPSISANQNPNKNCPESEKDTKQEKKSVGIEEKRIEKKRLGRLQLLSPTTNYQENH